MLPTGSARLAAGTRVAELLGMAEGRLWVQDAAAALPARCSARGRGSGSPISAPPRAARPRSSRPRGPGWSRWSATRGASPACGRTWPRLNLAAETVEADAAGWSPAEAGFDAVLLDAPCSATGIIRRHPDIPHLKRASDVAAMAEAQAKLLGRAAALLRPGGTAGLRHLLPPARGRRGAPRAGRGAGPGARPDPARGAARPGRGADPTRHAPHPAGHVGGARRLDGFFAARFIKR
jgi:16S rRNA (cytosine967-C5)-methyltransferase